MSASINKVTIIGNLGRDVEMKTTKSGMAVAELAVATSYGTGDKEETEWHKVTVWDKTAEACAKFLAKGSSVYVEGRLKTETYEKDGEKRYSTKIVASEVKFLGGKNPAATGAPVVAAKPVGRIRAPITRQPVNDYAQDDSEDLPF